MGGVSYLRGAGLGVLFVEGVNATKLLVQLRIFLLKGKK